MTKEQAIAKLKAKRECIELDTNGNAELCDRNCGECKLNYEQGNMGEQKQALDLAIKALERYDDSVSLGTYKQVAKERDIAIEQLKELGYSFGEKIRTSEDCVSRAEVLAIANDSCLDLDSYEDTKEFCDEIKDLPPVMPTHCIAEVKFSKDDLREICNERIEIECTHGTCKDCKWWNSENNKIGYCSACKHGYCSSTWDIGIYRKTKADFYCADFEKRGNEK